MKKLLIRLLILILCVCSLGLIACGEPEHVCSFDRQIRTDTYKINGATCTEKATYYYSCECGKIGNQTFEYGEPLGHIFSNYVNNNDAKCEQNGTKTAFCSRNCGETDTIVLDNTALSHTYGEWVSNGDGTHTKTCGNDSTHTVTENCSGGSATETSKAKCEKCNGEYGTFADHVHNYNKQVASEKYQVSSATCTKKAVYNYSCACGEKGTNTFEYGNTLPHEYTKTKITDTQHWKECVCGAKSGVENHIAGAPATETTPQVCTKCNYVINTALGHVHTLHLTKVDRKENSCTQAGNASISA